MDFHEILEAAGLPPEGVAERVTQVVTSTVATLQARYPQTELQAPTIKYDLKGQTAGQAFYHQNLIRVNNALLYSNHKDEVISQTVPHEVAHIVAFQVYGSFIKPHGSEWQRMMHYLGLPARRCHNYEVKKARNRQKMERPYIYACTCCGREFKLTQILHRRIKQGRGRICPGCRTSIVYVETRYT